jgi:GMP synthase (glutamine-hydrolysing)
MPNILIAEGTPAVWQADRVGFGIPSNFSLFAAAVQLHDSGVRCTPVNIADGEALAFGTTLSDFDGVMFPGSPLHICDPMPCVTRQIDFARAAFAAGVPVWGSCWGLQLATVALGGSVRRNPRGRELPIARANGSRPTRFLGLVPPFSTRFARTSTRSKRCRRTRRFWRLTRSPPFRR